MASTVAAPIKGTMMRLVQLDACGVPVTGASSRVIISKGFVQVTQDPQYEDGEEFFERTADGTLCVNQLDPPTLKRFRLTTDLCSVDPDAAPMMIGARELTTTGPVSGTGFAMTEGTPTNKFSLEVWQQVAGSGACDPTGLQRYIYNAWPHMGNVRVGGYTIQNGRSTLQFMADTFAASTLWGDGPGTGTSWLPAGAGGFVTASDHWLWNITTNAPPVAAAGFSLLT
jgi:hypothetical protein